MFNLPIAGSANLGSLGFRLPRHMDGSADLSSLHLPNYKYTWTNYQLSVGRDV